MKKISCLILTVFYLCYIAGVTVYHHYCMGELVSWSLYQVVDKKCGKCGMEKHTEESKGCCQDIPTVVKADDVHLYSSIAFDCKLPLLSIEDLLTPSFFITKLRSINPAKIFIGHSPPLSKTTYFIRLQNFRI